MWERILQCKNCGHIVRFGEVYHKAICPNCGDTYKIIEFTPDGIHIVGWRHGSGRILFNGKWYKPWTWNDHIWEVKFQ